MIELFVYRKNNDNQVFCVQSTGFRTYLQMIFCMVIHELQDDPLSNSLMGAFWSSNKPLNLAILVYLARYHPRPCPDLPEISPNFAWIPGSRKK